MGGSGDAPKYEPVGLEDESEPTNGFNIQVEPLNYRRARVLCSYDAKDNSELNLVANEVKNANLKVNLNLFYVKYFQVIFVGECTPINGDYMHGKQGLLKGLVPKAFLEILD